VIRYSSALLLLLLLVIIQRTILDLFPLGWLSLEISLNRGRLRRISPRRPPGRRPRPRARFFLDCLTTRSLVSTPFSTSHLCLSMIVSTKVYAENLLLSPLFAGGCASVGRNGDLSSLRFFFGTDILAAIRPCSSRRPWPWDSESPFFSVFSTSLRVSYISDSRPAQRYEPAVQSNSSMLYRRPVALSIVLWRMWHLQVIKGGELRQRSEHTASACGSSSLCAVSSWTCKGRSSWITSLPSICSSFRVERGIFARLSTRSGACMPRDPLRFLPSALHREDDSAGSGDPREEHQHGETCRGGKPMPSNSPGWSWR